MSASKTDRARLACMIATLAAEPDLRAVPFAVRVRDVMARFGVSDSTARRALQAVGRASWPVALRLRRKPLADAGLPWAATPLDGALRAAL